MTRASRHPHRAGRGRQWACAPISVLIGSRHAAGMRDPVRVLIVDDHPAVRAGLEAALDAHPGFVSLGAVAGERELWPLYHGAQPDLVVLDYHLPESDGFTVCLQLKSFIPVPRVVIYSAYADSRLAVP